MKDKTPNAEVVPENEGGLPAEEPVEEQTAAGAEEAGEDDIQERLDSVVEERDRLLQEKQDLNDLLLRRAAEFDNFRKRTERDRSELIEYAASDAVKALLPILDDFERSMKLECADSEYAKGIALIYQRLADSLKKLGLEAVEALEQPFDPNFHHAIEMVETDEGEDHTVLEELQRGYLFKGRLLRPSMVRVRARR